MGNFIMTLKVYICIDIVVSLLIHFSHFSFEHNFVSYLLTNNVTVIHFYNTCLFYLGKHNFVRKGFLDSISVLTFHYKWSK